jgi:hypothetical protein
MIPYIRSVAPGIPVAASCGYGYQDLTACHPYAAGQSFAPDWFDWHCYAGPARSPRLGGGTGSHLHRGDNPAQLAIGETGDRLAPAQFRRYLRWPLGNA